MATDRSWKPDWQCLDQQYQVLNRNRLRAISVLGQNDWQTARRLVPGRTLIRRDTYLKQILCHQ